jgi:hypothetical protein
MWCRVRTSALPLCRVSSVDTVTRWGLDNRFFYSRQKHIFMYAISSRSRLGPTHFSVPWTAGSPSLSKVAGTWSWSDMRPRFMPVYLSRTSLLEGDMGFRLPCPHCLKPLKLRVPTPNGTLIFVHVFLWRGPPIWGDRPRIWTPLSQGPDRALAWNTYMIRVRMATILNSETGLG